VRAKADQRSDPAIPPIGAAESLRGRSPGSRRDRLRRDFRRALDGELAGLQDRAPEGWPPHGARAAPMIPTAGSPNGRAWG
jgi:hypothetical protein